MIINLLYEKETISFQACMTQLFIGYFVGGAEILLLVVMAYDCYVAICKPLHYLTVMNQRVGVLLLLLVGVAGFLHAVVQLFFVWKLPFCGPNVIDHYICDMYPLLNLSCTDTYIIGLTVVANDGTICVFMFILLLNPYGVILHSLKNVSKEGRQSLIHLWLPRYCDGSLFIPCVFCMLTSFHSTHWWVLSSVLHHTHTYIEPSNLYSEKWRDEKCHEKALDWKKQWGSQEMITYF